MKEPWSKFFWSDWEADHGLRLCSLAAQGLWMRMLCVCARHEPKGYLAINGHPLAVMDIARLAGVTETEAENLMEELDRNGVFSRNRTGTIYSRRMVKDDKRSKEGRKWKNFGLSQVSEKEGGNSTPLRGAARGSSPHIPEAKGLEEKENIRAAEAIRLDAPAKADLTEAWDQFRRAYPSREGSQDWARAKDVFAKAVKAGVSADAIIGGGKRYLAECRRQGIEGTRFVKQARSWLNGRLWEEYAGPPAEATSSGAPVEIDWRGVVRSFTSNGNWPFRIGPSPSQSGCRAPPEILAEFGLPAGGEARENA